jgi:hypothetical protein
MLRFRILLACLPALAWGACHSTSAPPPDPASFVTTLAFVDLPTLAWEGQTVPVVLRAADGGGHGVPDVRVQFRALAPESSLAATTATTDSAGLARVEVTLGWPQSGWNAIEAAIDNPAVAPIQGAISTVRRPRVSFERDSVRLAGVGAHDTLFARVLDAQGELMIGHGVAFVASEPGVVSFYTITVSAARRGMLAGVRGERAGSTRVIATHASGAADTAWVQVLSGTP